MMDYLEKTWHDQCLIHARIQVSLIEILSQGNLGGTWIKHKETKNDN